MNLRKRAREEADGGPCYCGAKVWCSPADCVSEGNVTTPCPEFGPDVLVAPKPWSPQDTIMHAGAWRELILLDAVSKAVFHRTKARVELVCPWWMPARFCTWLIRRCFRLIEVRG